MSNFSQNVSTFLHHLLLWQSTLHLKGLPSPAKDCCKNFVGTKLLIHFLVYQKLERATYHYAKLKEKY